MVTKEILSLVAKNIGDRWPAVYRKLMQSTPGNRTSQEIQTEVESIKLKCGDDMEERVCIGEIINTENEMNFDVRITVIYNRAHISAWCALHTMKYIV